MNPFEQIRAALFGKPAPSKKKLSNAWDNKVSPRTHKQGIGFHPATGAPVYTGGGIRYDAATGRPLADLRAPAGPPVPPRLQTPQFRPGDVRADGKIFVNDEYGFQSPATILSERLLERQGPPVPPRLRQPQGPPVPPRLRQPQGPPVPPRLRQPQGPPVPPRLQQKPLPPDLNGGMAGTNWPAGVPTPGTPVDPSTWTNIKASLDPAAPRLQAPATTAPGMQGSQPSAPAGGAAPPPPAMAGSALPPGTTPQVIRTADGNPSPEPVGFGASPAAPLPPSSLSSPASPMGSAMAPPPPVAPETEVPNSMPEEDPQQQAAQALLGQTVQALQAEQQGLSLQDQIRMRRLGYLSGSGNS